MIPSIRARAGAFLCHAPGVNKLCIFAGTTIFGILGGMLAGALGMEMFSLGSFLLSGVGSIVGVYVGWKVARKLG